MVVALGLSRLPVGVGNARACECGSGERVALLCVVPDTIVQGFGYPLSRDADGRDQVGTYSIKCPILMTNLYVCLR